MTHHKFYTIEINEAFSTQASELFSKIENDSKHVIFQFSNTQYALGTIKDVAYFYNCLRMVYKVPQSAFLIDAMNVEIPLA